MIRPEVDRKPDRVQDERRKRSAFGGTSGTPAMRHRRAAVRLLCDGPTLDALDAVRLRACAKERLGHRDQETRDGRGGGYRSLEEQQDSRQHPQPGGRATGEHAQVPDEQRSAARRHRQATAAACTPQQEPDERHAGCAQGQQHRAEPTLGRERRWLTVAGRPLWSACHVLISLDAVAGTIGPKGWRADLSPDEGGRQLGRDVQRPRADLIPVPQVP